MFNRSAILKDAWARYRRAARGENFTRSTFSFYLGTAWDVARRSAMTATQRRAVAIEEQIAALTYRPARQNIEPIRRKLEAELAAIAA